MEFEIMWIMYSFLMIIYLLQTPIHNYRVRKVNAQKLYNECRTVQGNITSIHLGELSPIEAEAVILYVKNKFDSDT